MRFLAVADLFCGAGGFDTGAARAIRGLGRRHTLVAVNHWAVAIETHRQNHPDAVQICSDVYALDPLEAVPGGRLDLLMASPTCVTFSRARGGRPISWDQTKGRMTPTQVLRWITQLDVRVLLVENVPEFLEWGPCDPVTQRPRPEKRGVHFRAWVRRIERLGYAVEHRVLNAADYGDATTRSRLFLIARKDGKPIRWPEPTHSKKGSSDLFGGGSKKWRAAREVIDWSLSGRSIFGRKKPLSPKTLARIYAGAVRFGWPEPFLVVLRNHMAERGLDDPLPALTAGGTHVGLVEPFVMRSGMHKSNALCARSPEDPLATVTTDGGFAVVEPFTMPTTHHDVSCRARSAGDPLPTITSAHRGELALVEPFVLSQASGGAARSTGEPVPTIPARGAHELIVPFYGQSKAASVEAPLPTVTTRDRFAFVAAAFGERAGQAPRVHSIDEPAPTVCATGRVNLVQGEPTTYDVRFRMLQPHELAAAMGFDGYRFAGNKSEVTRQIGNAVPVRTAEALVRAVLA